MSVSAKVRPRRKKERRRLYVEGEGLDSGNGDGPCDVNYLEYVDVFLKRTAKSARTLIIMPIYEHVMNMLIHVEILAFEMPIERKSFRVLFRPEIFRPFSLLLYSSRPQN